MRARGEQRDIGVRRRPMHGQKRFAQRTELQRRAQFGRNEFERRVIRQAFQRSRDHAGQPFLAEAFGRRINRRQPVIDGGLRIGAETRVLRMHHLGSVRAMTHVAIAKDAHAGRELFGLASIEMEETQDQRRARIVADRDAQLRPITESALHRFDDAFDLRTFADAKIADRRDVRAILVTQRQVKPEILHRAQAKLREQRRKRRADAGQRRSPAPDRPRTARLRSS